MTALLRFPLALCILLSLAQPTRCSAQADSRSTEADLIKKIQEEKRKIRSFQAFGVREQVGPYFDFDVPLKNGKPVPNSYSPKKFVYIAFQQDQVRAAERNYSEEENGKKERQDLAFFSSSRASSVYYEKSGFHLVRNTMGGRYIHESARTNLANPPQALGFWVPSERKWPDELLASGRYHIVRQVKNPQFGSVIEIAGKQDNETSILFSLAPEFSCRVVESLIVTSNQTIHTVLGKVVNVNGVWLPQQLTRVLTTKSTGKSSKETWFLDKVSLNDVKEKDVRFQATVGDHNQDMDTKRHSYTLGGNQRRYVEETRQSFSELWKGWLYMVSVTALLSLTVGAYANWKLKSLRRQS